MKKYAIFCVFIAISLLFCACGAPEPEPHESNIAIGETVAGAEFDVTLSHMYFTEDVMPSKPLGAYGHYPLTDASKIYVVAAFDITNHSDDAAIRADSVADVRFLHKGTYEYELNSAVEIGDGASLSYAYSTSLYPEGVTRLYYFIDLPKEIVSDGTGLEIKLVFDGNTYYYNCRLDGAIVPPPVDLQADDGEIIAPDVVE